jgi:hypothetical protein
LSFILESSIHRTVLYSDFNFVPFYNQSSGYDISKSFSWDIVTAFGLAPGVMGTLVYKSFFASLFAVLGGEVQNHSFSSTVSSAYLEKWYLSPFLDLRSSIGYNNKHVFASLNFKLDLISMNYGDFAIEYNYLLLSASLGYKFNSPKFLDAAHKFVFKKYKDVE